MTTKPTVEQMEEAVRLTGGKAQASAWLAERGMYASRDTIRRALAKHANQAETNFDIEVEEDFDLDELDVEELVRTRISQYERKYRKEMGQRVIPVRCKLDGPIGIGFMGDPHVDDDGTDLKLLFEHVDLFDGRVEGLFAGCLGDMWNNWVGRMGHLWSEQSSSATEARALVRHFLQKIHWLFVVFGNHDAWAGHNELLQEILKAHVVHQKKWQTRLAIRFPNDRILKIFAAHDFPGRSMWSEVFGANKRAMLDGQNDIYVCGDSHCSGYTHGMHGGSQTMFHAVQVASYKKMDRYAEELGLDNKHLYACPVAIVDPYATDPVNFVRWEFDPKEAAERLTWMRERWKDNA